MVTFILSPFLADATSGSPVLDYSSKLGKEHYRVVIERVDPETGFDLNRNNCLALLDLFAAQTEAMGWGRASRVLWIPDDTGKDRYIVSQ